MYIGIAFSIELRLRVSRSLRSLANYTKTVIINKLIVLLITKVIYYKTAVAAVIRIIVIMIIFLDLD